MTSRIVHFLLHVPKCAGTTVETHFRTHLNHRFLMAPRWENVLRNVIGNRYPSLDAASLDGVQVVSGHSLSRGLATRFPGAQIRESVLIRDPVSFMLSLYNYRWTRFEEGWGDQPPPFERWYRSQRRNPVSRFLLVRYFDQGVPALYRLSSSARLAFLEQRLAQFHFVGSWRRTDEMIGRISASIGIPGETPARNVSTARRMTAADLSIAMRQRIERENALDQALFDRWADRGWAGAPDGPPPSLPSDDRLSTLIGDTGIALRKKL